MAPVVRWVVGGLLLGGALASVSTTQAAEGGLSFYVSGQAVPLGGIIPPIG
jgi:hypothetical protein